MFIRCRLVEDGEIRVYYSLPGLLDLKDNKIKPTEEDYFVEPSSKIEDRTFSFKEIEGRGLVYLLDGDSDRPGWKPRLVFPGVLDLMVYLAKGEEFGEYPGVGPVFQGLPQWSERTYRRTINDGFKFVRAVVEDPSDMGHEVLKMEASTGAVFRLQQKPYK